MKKSNLIIVFFVSILILMGLFLLVVSPKVEFSLNENRYLEKFPKLSFQTFFSGDFSKKMTDYVSDHFPFRDFLVGLHSKGEVLLGKRSIHDVYLGEDEYLLERYYHSSKIDSLVQTLNRLYQNVNYVNMSMMLVPTSISVNASKLPLWAITDSEQEDIEKIYYGLTFNSIPIFDELLEGNQDYPMFYRLDHHWTSYGAYYAYLKYCQMNDLEPLSMDAFDVVEVSDSFRGTLYSKTAMYQYQPDKIHKFVPKNGHYEVHYVMSHRITDCLYEEKYLKQKDQYSYFLDNNHPLIEITNLDSDSTAELVVIKDSFANSFIPFLVNHYKKVHVIDPRFYKERISDYIQSHVNVKDVLFLYNIHTLENDLGIYTVK